MARIAKRIHYRRLNRDGNNFPTETLSNRIAAALNKDMPDGRKVRQWVGHRIADVPEHPDYRRALNNYNIGEDFVFGTTCLFAPGRQQALLKVLQESAEQVSLADLMEAYDIAESTAPKGHEYLTGLSYWLAKGDHFYQIQHISLQAGQMEQYLTWLLRDQTQVIDLKQAVMLQAVFDSSQLSDDDLKFVQVGGIVPESLALQPQNELEAEDFEETDERRSIAGETVAFGKGLDILSVLFGDLKVQELLKRVPDEAALEVSVNIGYRSRRRKLSKQFMKDLATGLRNLPDGELVISGKGGKAKGQDARLYLDMQIDRVSENSSLLDLKDVQSQMEEVHRRFLYDGKIQ